MSTSSNASRKRKLSNDDSLEDFFEDSASTAPKKTKLSTSATTPPAAAKAKPSGKPKETKVVKEQNPNVPSEEYPNGYFYCHQCNRKRDMSEGVHCTYKREGAKGKIERCKAKYCVACLKNRYQEDMDTIKSSGVSDVPLKQRAQHVSGETYIYKCPRCKDECNCRFCRKAKGLEPTGNLNLIARRAEKAAAAERAKNEPSSVNASGSSNSIKGRKASRANGSADATQGSSKSRSRPKPKASVHKPIPNPVWTRIATDLTLHDAETRMQIREFVVRFASVLQIAHSHLEELEELSGDNLGDIAAWDDDENAGDEIISWVSELCAKSIVQGLLDAIAGELEARGEHDDATLVKDAIRNVKSSGANLSRLWSALLALREALGPRPSLVFADPLPPPVYSIVRTTRQNRDGDATYVSTSAQLIPVISDLIEAAIPSPAIREALETGALDEKEYTKWSKEAIAKENARWKEVKETKEKQPKQKGETKALRDRHHQAIEDLEYAGRLAGLRCVPRFTPLGRDLDGRLYYALTPGFGESEAAINLLRGKNVKVKVGKKRGGFSEDDRKEMERWNWFVAVWGRKPEGAIEVKHERDDDEDEDEDDERGQDTDEDAWWGFWQPDEIVKMADWLGMRSGFDAEVNGATSTVSSKDLPVPPKNSPPKAEANANLKSLKAAAATRPNGSLTRSRTSTSSGTSSTLSSIISTREPSPLSDISDLSDEEGNGDASMLFETPEPTKRDMQELVKGLKDFADLLKWRIKRASIDTIEKSKTH